MTLAIQEFLRSHNPKSAIRHAVEKWGLKTHEEGDLVQLNYHMIESPRGIREVDECRGLILKRPSWEIVSYPFFRFYNDSEGHAANVKSRNATLVQKLDGSLISLYPYGGQWRVATRGRIFADGTVGREDMTFNDLFWATAAQRFLKEFQTPNSSFPENRCFIFELTAPDNRVVTPYPDRSLSLLMARDTITWEELSPEELDGLAEMIGSKRPAVYDFKDRNHISNMLKIIGQLDEGYVFVDYTQKVNGNYKRVKIKNPSYLAAARLVGHGFDHKRALEVVLLGETSELLAYFPEYQQIIQEVEERLFSLTTRLDKIFQEIAPLAEGGQKTKKQRKAFALRATKTEIPWVCFALLDGKAANAREALINNAFTKDGGIISKNAAGLWDILRREE